MAKRIELNPIVLEEDVTVFENRLSKCLSFVDHVNIDFIDWYRTDDKTIGVDQAFTVFEKIEKRFTVDYDLMLDYPKYTVEKLASHPNTRSICINLESKENILELIDLIHKSAKWAGISVNPENMIDSYKELIEKVDMINILTVDPGRQGNEFLSEMLFKANELVDYGYKGHISIDGGVKVTNIIEILKHPFDIISVGSFIVKSQNPEESYTLLQEEINSY